VTGQKEHYQRPRQGIKTSRTTIKPGTLWPTLVLGALNLMSDVRALNKPFFPSYSQLPLQRRFVGHIQPWSTHPLSSWQPESFRITYMGFFVAMASAIYHFSDDDDDEIEDMFVVPERDPDNLDEMKPWQTI